MSRPVVKPVIEKRGGLSSENHYYIHEIEPVALEIGLAFGFVPFKPHKQCSYKL